MKNKLIKSGAAVALMGVLAISCVKTDDFTLPEITFEEPDVTVNFSIQAVKDAYQGFVPALLEGDELYIEGHVVSSDEAGNFFRELVIQDKPENPTAGISISTEQSGLYTFFEPGRKVYFRVDGLYSGEFASKPVLGVLRAGEVVRMNIDEFESRIQRSTEVREIIPADRTVDQISEDDLNTLIRLVDVQLMDDELGQPYAHPGSNFSANRTLISCVENDTIILRNSGFADFKSELMPEGKGSVTAVLGIFGEDLQVHIRDTNDMNLDGERCEIEDPIEPAGTVFSEDFEDMPVGEYLNEPGWTNVNTTGGDRRYEVRTFENNRYAQISAFGSGENPVTAWLVTPGIDLENTLAPILTFLTKDAFNNGDALRVHISTGFSGDVQATDWIRLEEAVLATGSDTGFAPDFTPSGEIDLSAYLGQTIYIGFEYRGGDGGVTTTFQIDDIKVVDE